MTLEGMKTYSEEHFKNKIESGQVHITEYLQLRAVKEMESVGIR